MKTLYRFLIVIIILALSPSVVQAKEIKYNHNSIKITDVKKKVDYKVFVPKNIPENWTLEIKTYPLDSEEIHSFALHYMNKNDTKLMVSIEESNKANRSLDNSFEKIKIGDNTIFFKQFSNWDRGGTLYLTKGGTFINIESQEITKKQMMQIAKSLK